MMMRNMIVALVACHWNAEVSEKRSYDLALHVIPGTGIAWQVEERLGANRRAAAPNAGR